MTEEAKKPGRPPKKETFACELLRDYWDENGERVRKGTIVDLAAGDAIDGIERGIWRRVK